MYQLFFTPEWFKGFDLVFDMIMLFIALLIAAYSWKIYRFSKENKFSYFTIAFVTVALSFMAKIFTHSVLYFFPVREVAATVLRPLVGTGLQFADLFYRSAFFAQMFLMLAALLLIFFVAQKSRDRLKKLYEVSQMALFAYLIFLISFVANFNYVVFYLTSTVILGLIVVQYYKIYLNANKNKNTFNVMWGFLFILISNVFFVFVYLWNQLYVVGEVFMLIGFLVLLRTYRRIKRRSNYDS